MEVAIDAGGKRAGARARARVRSSVRGRSRMAYGYRAIEIPRRGEGEDEGSRVMGWWASNSPMDMYMHWMHTIDGNIFCDAVLEYIARPSNYACSIQENKHCEAIGQTMITFG